MTAYFSGNAFLIAITVQFALGAVVFALEGKWPAAGYMACAAGLQCCVMLMGAK